MALPVHTENPVVIKRVLLLPKAIAAALSEYCAASGENQVDVVSDAIALHLDELEVQSDV